jgi:glycosyltransferase involved in cell wall biosynthesis
LVDEFGFLVMTGDRDLGVATPLPGVVSDRWVGAGAARCLYLSPWHRRLGGLLWQARKSRHDALYLNSLFSLEFTLIPLALRRLGLIPRRGLVVAPRGELHPSALAIKRTRKRMVLWLVRRLGLLDDAIWHAATTTELQSVHRLFGPQARGLVARDITAQPGPAIEGPAKEQGALELAFVSRISPMKNLEFAIKALRKVRGRVNFNIYGPIEDPHYWAECQRLASELPPNVRLEYRGLVEPDRIAEVVAAHHLFFLPTQGESFGHAITEALMAGRPVLISDQTPWHGLAERHAGWDLPLSQPDLFAQVIERCVQMSAEEHAAWTAGARRLGREIAEDPALDAAHRAIFRAAVQTVPATLPSHS